MKIIKTTLIVLTLVMINQIANAQIIYTDVNPDVISPKNKSFSYYLDLNNDGISDFVVTHTVDKYSGGSNCNGTKTSNSITISPYGSNQILDYSLGKVSQFSTNSLVSSSSITWSNSANQVIRLAHYACDPWIRSWYYFEDGWSPATDGYVGLKFIANGNTYYGWLRMSTVSDASQFTIKDYAFDNTPDHSILTGNATGAIKAPDNYTREVMKDFQVDVYPNPLSSSTTISFSLSQSQKISLKIFDMNGKLVKAIADKMFESGDQQIKWNTLDVKAGIYLLRMEGTNYSETKKLVVIK